jgi:hypothetical protein
MALGAQVVAQALAEQVVVLEQQKSHPDRRPGARPRSLMPER